MFDGRTGRELQTVDYKPGRHDDGLMRGDYALPRIEPGNRVDRFLAGVGYLDGRHPSAVFARGYYTRSTLVAYDWDGRQLSQRWYVDSGWTPMSNPFDDSPHGRDGTDPEFGTLTTQGFHSLSAADVDGDAMHVTDIDPVRKGLEIFSVHEGATSAPYGMAMRQAEDGKVIFGAYSGRDTGRGMIGDVVPGFRGIESWSSMPGGSEALGLHTPTGQRISASIPGTNQSIRWAADMTTQIVNGSGDQTPTIDDWQLGRLLTAEGTRTNNGTKGNASLVADVFGDWREELLVRTTDSSAIRIYLSTEVTDRKPYTLMHDVPYRPRSPGSRPTTSPPTRASTSPPTSTGPRCREHTADPQIEGPRGLGT